MFDPRPLCCSSLTTAVGGTTDQILLIPLTLPWHESNGAVAGDGALVQVRSCGTLVILITSFGEFLLYFIVIFLFSFHKTKKNSAAGSFLCCFCVALFQLQDCISSGLN